MKLLKNDLDSSVHTLYMVGKKRLYTTLLAIAPRCMVPYYLCFRKSVGSLCPLLLLWRSEQCHWNSHLLRSAESGSRPSLPRCIWCIIELIHILWITEELCYSRWSAESKMHFLRNQCLRREQSISIKTQQTEMQKLISFKCSGTRATNAN